MASARFNIRKAILTLLSVCAMSGILYWWMRFPPDTTPEGAYLRIATAIDRGQPHACFAYLEEEAQHAAFSIVDYAKKASALIRKSYPEPARSKALETYRWAATCHDGPEAWVQIAKRRAWIARLRRDLSGIDHVEQQGPRATVVTAHGTRYPFRQRPNQIWGLTMFTAELEAEAGRLARDWSQIQKAAQDYRRAINTAATATVASPQNP